MFESIVWRIEPILSLLYMPSTGIKMGEIFFPLLKLSLCFAYNVNSVFRNVLSVADLTSQPNSFKYNV